MAQAPNPQSEQLVREAVEALKAGDKALARGKLETAVKIDQYNEKAWFYLAGIVETDEERRTCLGNVVIINPQNERAQKMLDKLEGRGAGKSDLPGSIDMAGGSAGGSRKRLLIIGGVGGALLLLAVIFMMMSGGGDGEIALPTEIPSSTPFVTPDVAATETAQASITPTLTITPTPGRPTLPPSWTPLPQATDTPPPQQFPAPPAELIGRIILQIGRTSEDPDDQPLWAVNPGSPESLFIVSSEGARGQNPALDPNANRFIWALYSSGTRSHSLQVQAFNSAASVDTATLYGSGFALADPNEPAWAGNQVAFTGQAFNGTTRDLWLLDISQLPASSAPPPVGSEPTATVPPPPTTDPALTGGTPGEAALPADSALTQLTVNVNASQPAFGPDGSAVVFVAEEQGMTDLRVVLVSNQQVFTLTSNANALVESWPDWAVYNGVNEVVFSASQGNANTTDIYIMPGDASEDPRVLIDLGPHDEKPRFSPDGRYIAFSTDYSGSWDVIIYDRETEQFYSLATDPQLIERMGDWTN